MRRTISVGAVTPIVALGFLACTHAVLLAQSPKTPTPGPTVTPAPVPLTPFGSEQSGTIMVVPQAQPPALSDSNLETLGANPIRQRFLELSKKKAAALNEEELKREVESMETEVRELEAWVKVQQAVRQLHEVVEKHPNTKAAETANAAIQLIEERRVSPRFTREAPRPDPNFRRAAPESDPGPVPIPGRVFDRPRDVRPPQTSEPQFSPTS
jgi:uncharacterized protein YqgV (UPF0045/DUF77 family)